LARKGRYRIEARICSGEHWSQTAPAGVGETRWGRLMFVTDLLNFVIGHPSGAEPPTVDVRQPGSGSPAALNNGPRTVLNRPWLTLTGPDGGLQDYVVLSS
jgi:hypothetical protein